jgi:predicted Rossmann fold nucleotide-binding protein DprA/Smf involved in DNA uptake
VLDGARQVRRVEPIVRVRRGEAGYPAGLLRLGAGAPEALELHGNVELLQAPPVGLFCSLRPPGRTIVESYLVARALASSDAVVAGGFHSPLEREVLEYLLRGSCRVVLCPARSLQRMRLPRPWQAPLEAGRMLLLSPFPATVRRPGVRVAERRNRVVAALSGPIIFLHATPGGRVARLAQEAAGWAARLHCLEHPWNEDLRVLGAATIEIQPVQRP